MDEYSNKSPEELRWEEYNKLWRYSEPLKPLLELDQKFDEKSSIIDAGRRSGSSANKGENQAAAINDMNRVIFWLGDIYPCDIYPCDIYPWRHLPMGDIYPWHLPDMMHDLPDI